MIDGRKLGFTLMAALLVSLGLAQDDTNGTTNGEVATNDVAETMQIGVYEHELLGSYLADEEGRALYALVNEQAEVADERTTEGVRENVAPCEGQCQGRYQAIRANEVTAGEGIDEELLYLAEVDGSQQVVYNGYPLYRYLNDLAEGHVTGRGHGQTPHAWYLLSPEGSVIHPSETDAGEAPDQDDAQDGADETDGVDDMDGADDMNGTEDTEGGAEGGNGVTGAEGDEVEGDEGDDADGAEDATGAEDMDGADETNGAEDVNGVADDETEGDGDDGNGQTGAEGDEVEGDDQD